MEAGIAVEEGKIVKVGKETLLPLASDKVDLNGCLVLPGLIDAHVHLRDQLQSYEEDFESGTAAAVVGGITSVLDMPNNQPVTMSCASLKERIKAAEQRIVANVGFFSAFPKSLDEIVDVVEEGAVAFKLYLTTQIGGVDIDDDEALLQAFEKVSDLEIPVSVHAEDRETVKSVSETEKKLRHNGIDAYLKAHSSKAEIEAVKRILKLVYKCNVQAHFCHMSSEESVFLVHTARKNNLRVSCEVTPHHLLLTTNNLIQQGTVLLTDPPVRNKNVTEKLWNAVKAGYIDMIASDHAPHLLAEKKADSVWDVKPGFPGLETLLPLLLTKVNEGQLSIHELVRMTAEKPSEIFGLHGEGFLKEGFNANITVVDMHRRSRIDVDKFYSKAKYSPFDGWQVEGIPVKTFVNGQQVMDEGVVITEKRVGRILHSKSPIR